MVRATTGGSDPSCLYTTRAGAPGTSAGHGSHDGMVKPDGAVGDGETEGGAPDGGGELDGGGVLGEGERLGEADGRGDAGAVAVTVADGTDDGRGEVSGADGPQAARTRSARLAFDDRARPGSARRALRAIGISPFDPPWCGRPPLVAGRRRCVREARW